MILPKNVYVDDMSIGEEPLEKTLEFLDARVNNILNRKISVISNYNNNTRSQEFSLRELGYKSNIHEVKEDISRIINNDLKLISKYRNYKKIEENGKKFEIKYSLDYDEFIKALEAFDNRVLKKPVNAEQLFEEGEFIVIGGDIGYKFDKDKLYKELNESIDDLNSRDVFLDLKVVEPEITTEDIEKRGIKEKVASYTTQFNPGNKERSANVRLAAKKIKGTVIAPGETFSFNETVGQRTVERGFKEAGVYIRGRVDKDIGGGICQVSTTLYNATLFHDLDIVERSNHSLTVPYVPLSRDAAVNWGTKDFKFKNNTEYYIYIDAVTSNNKITFDLYSTRSDKEIRLQSVQLSSEEPWTEYKEDETLRPGVEKVEEKGHAGYRSKLIKHIYKDGQWIESKEVSKDRYLTAPKVIAINTKAVKQDTNEEFVETEEIKEAVEAHESREQEESESQENQNSENEDLDEAIE